MKRTEHAIQAAVIRWVKEELPSVIICATQNELSYKDIAQIGHIGISDLILFHADRRVLFLELKQKKGKLSQVQKDFLSLCYHPCDVAYGFSEAKRIIGEWAHLR